MLNELFVRIALVARYGRDYEAHEDPGVLSVKEIWTCYKGNNIQTEVMAASFRNTGTVLPTAASSRQKPSARCIQASEPPRIDTPVARLQRFNWCATGAGEIKQLAGLDLLTVSPALLQELQNEQAAVPCLLSKDAAANTTETRVALSLETRSAEKKRSEEASFRFAMNENAMATEKLAEGIRVFSADMTQLETLLIDHLALA